MVDSYALILFIREFCLVPYNSRVSPFGIMLIGCRQTPWFENFVMPVDPDEITTFTSKQLTVIPQLSDRLVRKSKPCECALKRRQDPALAPSSTALTWTWSFQLFSQASAIALWYFSVFLVFHFTMFSSKGAVSSITMICFVSLEMT